MTVEFYDPSLPTLSYEDIDRDWQKNPVYFVSTKGYMTGIQDGYFGPYWGMTRAMVATILYRMAGAPAVANAQTSFEDVDAAAWYGPAVAWAKEKGMINGYSPTQFAPDDYITREQMAALLWRYAGSPAPTQALTATDQDSISDWAKSAMAWAQRKGDVQRPQRPHQAPAHGLCLPHRHGRHALALLRGTPVQSKLDPSSKRIVSPPCPPWAGGRFAVLALFLSEC